MTIKEIEARSGMTRANIRFYEAEGLLTPERRANGYREYSENDLAILLRIKLLRTLHMSLEEIKALHNGEQELPAALDQHLAQLDMDLTDIQQSQQICRSMRQDGVGYQTLDAQRYLDDMERLAQRPLAVPQADVTPKVRAPWRRFFARGLDTMIYSTLWSVFLMLALNVNMTARSTGQELLDALACLLLMLFVEPLLLSRFAATPGKWLLGLRVTDNDDQRLTYGAALERTWTMFCRGMGLSIPIYNLVRLWKSYTACDSGETLEWEYDSALTLRDERGWRALAYIGAYAVLIGGLLLALAAAETPKHRGELTVAEFCENYNRFSDYFGLDTLDYLNEHGVWIEKPAAGYGIRMGDTPRPTFVFSEADGCMTGLSFSVEIEDDTVWPSSYQNEMSLAILAFVKAQPGAGLLNREVRQLLQHISDAPFADFTYMIHGVDIACDVEYSGYQNTASMGLLWPQDGAEVSYSLAFSMEKQ